MNNLYHIGVYALIIKNKQVLLIRNENGLHPEKLDLPGGPVQTDESPEAALIRTLKQSTNLDLFSFQIFNFYSEYINPEIPLEETECIHHYGAVYKVEVANTSTIPTDLSVESPLGAYFYSINESNLGQLSPFATEAIRLYYFQNR